MQLQEQAMTTSTVRVDLDRRGNWEIALSDQRNRVVFKTLDDAVRVARQCAAHRHPCELVVLDAYHRVLQREIIDDVAHASCAGLRHGLVGVWWWSGCAEDAGDGFGAVG